MKKVNLNLIPIQLEKGFITTKEAVNKISVFVSQNSPVFGLQKYDEDFRSDIVLDILEHGNSLMEGYDKERGDFFTYLYYQIKSFIHARTRTFAKRSLEVSSTLPEEINMEKEKEDDYNKIDYKIIEKSEYVQIPKVPYAIKEINPEELKKTFENVHGDKKLLVVAIKSAYYITDRQLEKICSHYKIDENDFFKTIQYCRNSLTKKADKKLKLQERRNSAYMFYKKLETQIHILENKTSETDSFIQQDFKLKEKKYRRYWESLNKQLEEGLLSLRPTNKTIASILGICERQVAYYITCVKNEESEKEAAGDEN